MSFLTPLAFLLAVLLPVIIAMYLLKLRRTEQVVSSVYLWRRMVRDVEANAPWQKLRRNLLMFLQLLFLAALILALAQPFTWVQGASGQSVILILDASASMQATDMSPTRLEAAKEQARQIVAGLPDDARVTLIAAAGEADVLTSASSDRRAIFQALDQVQASSLGSDLSAALGLAAAIAARQPDPQILILSDGRVQLPERLALKAQVTYLPIGLDGSNQAISLLSLKPAAGEETASAFAQVTNYSSQAVTRRLELYGEGRLLNAYDLEIEAGGQQAVVAENLSIDLPWIEARLAGQDTLPVDDHAWAVLESLQPVEVTLVTAGNLFLETALGLLPGIELSTIRPLDYEAGQAGSAEEDPSGQVRLTIFDTYVPVTATLPAGNLLFVAPPRSTSFFTVTGSIEAPILRPSGIESPILANVDLETVNVLDGLRLSLPVWADELAVFEASDGSQSIGPWPALFAGETAGRQVAVLAFDVRRSDLPLQVAFPLLLTNLVDWFNPNRGAALPAAVMPGQAVPLSMQSAGQTRVVRPDGTQVQIGAGNGQAVFADTRQFGLYEVRWGEDNQAYFAVNLFSPQESDVEPVQTLSLPGSAGEEETVAANQARREWWRPLGFIALGFLTTEWLVYQRASVARAWQNLRRVFIRTLPQGKLTQDR